MWQSKGKSSSGRVALLLAIALSANGLLDPGPWAASANPVAGAKKRSKQPPAGLVLDLSGDWQVTAAGKARRLQQGDSIANHARLTCKSRAENDHIAVILVDGTTFTGGPDCDREIAVSMKPSVMDSWLAVVLSIISGRPTQWITAMSRPAGDRLKWAHISDGVVRGDAQGVNFGPVFEKVSDGTYILKLSPVEFAATGRTDVGPLSVSVNRPRPVTIPGQGLGPGPYRIRMMDSAEPHDFTGEQCLILIADNTYYDNAAGKYAQAVASADKWDGVSDDQKRSLLQQYLIYLSTVH